MFFSHKLLGIFSFFFLEMYLIIIENLKNMSNLFALLGNAFLENRLSLVRDLMIVFFPFFF